MSKVEQGPVPEDALLQTWRGGKHPELWGNYSDCFSMTVNRGVSLQEFVYAFYTSPVFRLERLILRWLANSPSTDEQARQLALGAQDKFAAWHVGTRTATQLLMCDNYQRTRSWFRIAPTGVGSDASTLLQFGSAIVAQRNAVQGAMSMSTGFRLMLGFHRIYSRVLLRAAVGRLAGLRVAGRAARGN